MTTKVDLEAFDQLPGGVRDQGTLEPDVGDLEACAGVGASVDVDADRLVEVGQASLKLVDQGPGLRLGLDDRELAELDTGAGHGPAPEDARPDDQVEHAELRLQFVDPGRVDVEDDQLLCGRRPDAALAEAVREVRDRGECGAGEPAGAGGEADREAPVGLLVDTDVVAPLVARRCRRRAVGQRRGQVLLLQGGPDPLGSHVRDQELQPGPGAHPPVAVVPEQARHPMPDLGDPVGGHEGAEPDPELGVRRQAAADPQVVTGAQFGVDDTDERDVVDLMQRAVVGAAGDRALELARQVTEGRVAQVEPDGLLDRRGRVDYLVPVDTGQRAPEDDSRGVTA